MTEHLPAFIEQLVPDVQTHLLEVMIDAAHRYSDRPGLDRVVAEYIHGRAGRYIPNAMPLSEMVFGSEANRRSDNPLILRYMTDVPGRWRGLHTQSFRAVVRAGYQYLGTLRTLMTDPKCEIEFGDISALGSGGRDYLRVAYTSEQN